MIVDYSDPDLNNKVNLQNGPFWEDMVPVIIKIYSDRIVTKLNKMNERIHLLQIDNNNVSWK
jgi:hypothetical protein